MGNVIAKKSDVPEGGCISIDVPDGKEIALFNVDGDIFALDNTCPHAGGPLGEGSMDESIVTCPWHGWSFDVRTGECQNNTDVSAKCVKVAVKGEDIILE